MTAAFALTIQCLVILAKHSKHELLLDVVAYQFTLCHGNDLQFKRRLSAYTILMLFSVASIHWHVGSWKYRYIHLILYFYIDSIAYFPA